MWTVTGVVVTSAVEVLSPEVAARPVGVYARTVHETLTVYFVHARRTNTRREVALGSTAIIETVAGNYAAIGCRSHRSLISIALTVTGEE